ncbi:unnamed protein product, partial [Scytosiphon promiscuus]
AGQAASGQASTRRRRGPSTRRRGAPPQAARRRSTIFLLLAAVAVGASADRAAVSGYLPEPALWRPSNGGDGGGPAVLLERSCGAEAAAACEDDEECRGCAAMPMASGTGGAPRAEPPPGGGSRGDGPDPFREYLSRVETRAPPLGTRCESVGAEACRWLVPAEEGHREEGSGARVAASERCLENSAFRGLLACGAASAGCEPRDAPCLSSPEGPLEERGFLPLSSSGRRSGDQAATLLAKPVGRGVRAREDPDPPPSPPRDWQAGDADTPRLHRTTTE